MDRLESLQDKIDNMLRDDDSHGAVFDVLPAWAAEYEHAHNMTPGTSGGSTLLDHYVREIFAEGETADDEHTNGYTSGVARFGRVVYLWNDAGFYSAHLYGTQAQAQQEFDTLAPEYAQE